MAWRAPVSGAARARPAVLGSAQAGERPWRPKDPRADALVVRLDPGGLPIEEALRRFTRAVRNAGLLRELRRREAFMPRAARRRAKSHKARQRARRAAERGAVLGSRR